MSVEFCGLRLAHRIVNASGTFDLLAAAQAFDGLFDPFPFAAFVSKTITLAPRTGNPAPRLWEAPAGLINSIGLPNRGLDGYLEHDLPALHGLLGDVPLITNVMGATGEELAALVEPLDARPEVSAIELNVSCPNVHTGLDLGADPRELQSALSVVRPRTSKPLIVKLTPNAADVPGVAAAAEASGADAVSLINTLRAMALRPGEATPWLGAGTGGLSGPAVRARGPGAGRGRGGARRDPRRRDGRRRTPRACATAARRGRYAHRGRHRELPRPGRRRADRGRIAGLPRKRRDFCPLSDADGRSYSKKSLQQNADGQTGAKEIGIFGHDEEAVGAGHGCEIARTLPWNESDFGNSARECANSGEKARKAGFCFHVLGEAREGKAGTTIEIRAVGALPGKRSDNRRGEEQERDSGRDGIAGKPKDAALRAAKFWTGFNSSRRNFAKDQRFSGLDANAGEMKARSGADECGLDQIEFSRGDATGDEQEIGGGGAGECGVEGFGGVASDGQDPRITTGSANHCGEHGARRVANLAGAGRGADGDKLVAGGENGHARLDEDIQRGATAGACKRNLRGSDQGAGRKKFVAFARLCAAGDDVFAFADGARRQEADGAGGCGGGFFDVGVKLFDVFKHDDGVSACGDGRAGHDFPGCAARKRTGRSLPGAR